MSKYTLALVLSLFSISVTIAEEDGWGGGESWKLPRHRTVQREERWEIGSIYPDLREGTFFTPPAMADRNGHGSATIGYSQDRVERNNLIVNDEGLRRAASIDIRESVVWGIGVELHIDGVDASYNEKKSIGDLRSITTVQVAGGRYWAIALEAGTELALKDGAEFDTSHQEQFKDPTYLGGLRVGVGIGPVVIGGLLRGRFQVHGESTTGIDRTTDDGELIPAGNYRHDYSEGSLGLSISYRFLREIRIGVESRGYYAMWDGKSGASDIKDWGCDIGSFVQVTPLSWMNINVGMDFDPTEKEHRSVNRRSAMAYRCGLQFIW